MSVLNWLLSALVLLMIFTHLSEILAWVSWLATMKFPTP